MGHTKTHCPHGHEYTEENSIYWTYKTGPRAGVTLKVCRTCLKLRDKARRKSIPEIEDMLTRMRQFREKVGRS